MPSFIVDSDLLVVIIPVPIFHFFLAIIIFSEFKVPFLDIFANKFSSFFTIQKKNFLPLAMLLLPNIGKTNGWFIMTLNMFARTKIP